MMRERKVLVTGADGFIGSHLTEALVAAGADVTALALYNSFDSHGWLDDLAPETRRRVQVLRGDIRDGAFVRRLVQGQHIVFHLAALIAIPQSYATAQTYVDTNIVGTLNVLEAARESCPDKVIVTSTSEVYGTALTMPIDESHPLQGQSPYSASKIGADMMAMAFAKSFDVPAVILRPFNTFGPRQSERAIIPAIIRQALDPNCPAIRVGDTSPLRDLTFVSDTVGAFMAVAQCPEAEPGQAYNAGTGQAVTIGDLIRMVGAIEGCDKPILHDPTRMRPPNSEVRALLASSDRLRALTGWAPRVSLEDGLRRTLDWWRGRLAAAKVRPQIEYIT
jgi:UDP-glucose 4-epimerase